MQSSVEIENSESRNSNQSKLTRTLESLNERRCRKYRLFDFDDHCSEDDNEEKNASTRFLQMQKNQLVELQEPLELYCNKLPGFF